MLNRRLDCFNTFGHLNAESLKLLLVSSNLILISSVLIKEPEVADGVRLITLLFIQHSFFRKPKKILDFAIRAKHLFLPRHFIDRKQSLKLEQLFHRILVVLEAELTVLLFLQQKETLAADVFLRFGH
jgi:hypothetical protein